MSDTTTISVGETYTEVATGITNALIAPRTGGGYRVHVGAAAPADGSNDFVAVGHGPLSLFGLDSAADKVFVRTEAGTIEFGIIRG